MAMRLDPRRPAFGQASFSACQSAFKNRDQVLLCLGNRSQLVTVMILTRLESALLANSPAFGLDIFR